MISHPILSGRTSIRQSGLEGVAARMSRSGALAKGKEISILGHPIAATTAGLCGKHVAHHFHFNSSDCFVFDDPEIHSRFSKPQIRRSLLALEGYDGSRPRLQNVYHGGCRGG